MGLAILTASKSKIDKDEKKLNQIMLNKGGIPYFIGYKSIWMFEV
jgi:hypothetical protein